MAARVGWFSSGLRRQRRNITPNNARTPLLLHVAASTPSIDTCRCLHRNASFAPFRSVNPTSAQLAIRNISTPAQPGNCSGGQLATEQLTSKNTDCTDSEGSLGNADVGGRTSSKVESTKETLSAGDLSDCPPALQEFVFTSPHPFPFTADPETLEPSQVKAVINILLGTSSPTADSGVYTERSRWCSQDGEEKETGDAKWLQYPEPNTLWPNTLLHNHRLQPFRCSAGEAPEASFSPSGSAEMLMAAGASPPRATEASTAEGESAAGEASNFNKLQLHMNRLRLEQLWKYSGVHGVSWDEIEEVYLTFRQLLHQRQERWESRKQQILEYAGVVCARRLRIQRLEFVKSAGVEVEALDEETREQLLVPRSRFRRMTRRLYYKWHDEYFAPWSPGGLQSVLKAHITLRMLQRETNERQLHLEPQASIAKCSAKTVESSKSSGRAYEAAQSARLVEQVCEVLKRPYEKLPIGSCGAVHTVVGLQKKGDSSDAYAARKEAPNEVGEDENSWDFSGVGRRRQRHKSVAADCQET
ncbi:uncharacterized protein LOC34619714 [Cyclospora cayetanensis]|uniref:Uncharacterized protein n=2 Tax=Cyclospora cayetanensis TaxID=88456 RepID=A0A1D3D208_9EIME|nr:uncharacterized protein LOC34619714 [Cyclospora cayetanensis]OEH77472.1 hypothetical protein cyc_02947 [Cyclospora cayetanensis]